MIWDRHWIIYSRQLAAISSQLPAFLNKKNMFICHLGIRANVSFLGFKKPKIQGENIKKLTKIQQLIDSLNCEKRGCIKKRALN
jgi:hypothetical protein